MFNKRDFNKEAKVRITTTIGITKHDLAQKNKIYWNEALEFGVQFLAAIKGDGITVEYPDNPLNDKIKKLTLALNDKCLEIEKLNEELENGNKPKK